MSKELDRLDRKILRALQAEGRLTNIELAERVNLSPTATAERVRRLTREGYITGYMTNAIRKLDCVNRTQLVAKAIRMKIIS